MSFFEKLKKGMGIEGQVEEKVAEEKKPRPKRPRKPKELKIKTEPVEPEVEVEVSQPVTEEEEKKQAPEVEIKKEKWLEPTSQSFAENLGGPEGELAIDVYQTETDLVIQSAIAGVKPEFLDISIEKDVVTIKGSREKPFEEEGDYFAQECYWGSFSREVILPAEVDPDRAEATMKEGILTIRIPKILREKKRKIKVKV
ncbi:hypothetical protein COT20_00090 [bacterium (Candidatus Gribaldobacteria) CG08_land_8_20_14_0_20_39_15]|uniref:SHSP domain-containing protein n=1 Tax=bacterium (Candidatus Gribaldobacteria) CG08_land_8_20_14_0_20_39_15 TaxID=2014273 RepID=A0A2M6XVB3_9BACT|nr:MAG: hypothetical protein COT20_00090 [bacterium (Candidatus Gribaldobacteria) CG08_land_8_20_14_0_20_39_15]